MENMKIQFKFFVLNILSSSFLPVDGKLTEHVFTIGSGCGVETEITQGEWNKDGNPPCSFTKKIFSCKKINVLLNESGSRSVKIVVNLFVVLPVVTLCFEGTDKIFLALQKKFFK